MLASASTPFVSWASTSSPSSLVPLRALLGLLVLLSSRCLPLDLDLDLDLDNDLDRESLCLRLPSLELDLDLLDLFFPLDLVL